MTSPQGGGFDLGNAHGSVTISAQDAFSTLERLESTVRNFATNINNIGSQISSFGTNLSIAMLPVAGAFTAGVNTAATFQDSLAEIQARAGLTDEAMEQISATALQLGADTAFSAQEASSALLMLLTAGLDTEQALATLPAVLTGAAAAGADLGQTANQVTNIMSSFQLEAAEAARIVEVMNQAAGASPAEMSEMGAALAAAGGDASRFGLSLEQTGAMLTVFARNGIRGENAATQLRSILTAMTADTADSNRAFDMVNSSLFDAAGNSRDFSVVLAEVEAGLQNLSAEDQAFVVQSLAGSFGRVGFNALLASDGIESVIGEMEQQASAADVAQARLDTFNGRMDALKGSVETLMITAFTPFIEAMTPMVEGITGVINSIAQWVDANQAIVQPILKVLSMLILLGPTLIGVGQAFKLVGFLIGSVMSPINLLLIGITLLSAAWTSNFMGIRDATIPIIQGIVHWFSRMREMFAANGLTRGLQLLFSTFEDGSNYLGNFFQVFGMGQRQANAFAATINRFVLPVINKLISVASTFFTAFNSAYRVFTSTLQSGFSVFQSLDFALQTFFANLGVGTPIISMVRSAILGLVDVVSQFWTAIQTGDFSNINFGDIATAILNGIGTAISLWSNWVSFITDNLITPMFDTMKSVIGSVNWGELGSNIIGFIFGGFTGASTGGMDWGSIFTSFMSAIANAALTVFDFMSWAVTNVILPLWSGIIAGLGNVNWGEVGSTLMGWLSGAFNTVVSWGTWVKDNIVIPMFDNLKTTVQATNWGEVGTTILGALGAAFTTVISWATWIYDNLLSPLVSNVAAAVATIDWAQVGTTLLSAIGTALSLYADYVNWIYTNILTPIVTFAGEAIASIDWYGVGAGIVNAIGTAITTVFDFIAWIVNSIFNPVTTNAEGAAGQIDWGMVGNAILNGIGMFLSGVFNFVTWLYENILSPMVLGAADAIAQTDWSAVGTNLMNAIKNALPNIAQWVQSNIITPITNALGNFNPMNLIGGNQPSPSIPSGSGVTSQGGIFASGGTGASAPNVVSMGTSIQGFAKGTNYIPQDMIALLHQGESVQPKEYNPAAGGTGGGANMNFSGANFYFTANSDAEARSHARSFKSELEELMRSS